MQEEVEKEEEEEEELRKIVFSRRRRRCLRRVVIETVRVWIRASNFFFDFNQFLLGFFQINVETDVVLPSSLPNARAVRLFSVPWLVPSGKGCSLMF